MNPGITTNAFAMRRRMGALLLLAASAINAGLANAQPFPSRPMEFVVHTSPGGGTDILARVTADILTRNKWITQIGRAHV